MLLQFLFFFTNWYFITYDRNSFICTGEKKKKKKAWVLYSEPQTLRWSLSSPSLNHPTWLPVAGMMGWEPCNLALTLGHILTETFLWVLVFFVRPKTKNNQWKWWHTERITHVHFTYVLMLIFGGVKAHKFAKLRQSCGTNNAVLSIGIYCQICS